MRRRTVRLPMSADDAREVLDAARLFLARHEQALQSGRPERIADAARGLLAAVEDELPAALRSVPPEESPAQRVATKRFAEIEGLVLQLNLLLHEEPQPGLGQVLRLSTMLAALQRALADARATLALWARERGHETPSGGDPHALLEAARAALRAGAPEAAAPLLDRALRLGLAAPLLGAQNVPASVPEALRLWRAAGTRTRFTPEACADAERRLQREAREDAVAAWQALDDVERLVNEAGMTPVDDAARERARAALRESGGRGG